MKSIQTFLKKFNRISFRETPKVLSLAWEKFFEIQHAQPEDIQELLHKLLKDLQIISKELADYINTPNWNRPTFYNDDDDDEYTIQYREYLENSSNAITPDLPIEEPDNSLSLGDEYLSTISEIESDKVIKSSVEDLVPIPSESEGIFDDTCDVPFCDNSPPLDVFNDHFEIFSDFNDDCTSSNDDSFEDINYVEASPPEDSLIMGNEELSIIPKKESDEFIKSNVEDLVPIPSEFEDTSGSDSECDLPFDEESLFDEDILEDNVKIYSNPLFEFNDEYISSDVNPLFDEVLEDIKCKDSYDSNLDESTLLVIPLFDSNKDEFFTLSNDIELLLHHDSSISVVSILEGFTDEPPLKENNDLFDLESKTNDWKKILYDAPIDDLIFDPGGDIDEIDAFLDVDISPDIEDGYHDSKGDVLYLKSLLSDDTSLSLPPKVFLDHDPRSLSDINNLKIMVKVFDPGIHEKKISPTYVSLPSEDRHYLSFTYVIRTFLPYFTYLVVSPFLLSFGSEDTIFDPDISAFHFSSLKPVAYESPMEVCSSSCFVPNIMMIWGESS
ncbi:hypothetical protein Tco_1018687 [Tanacetum coccineum]|uniref:Uncharacterized protein n=1 Tax=Tanacetum coccineum TaxID=301880 RepID=A0ABQ5FXJ9_9ASTR